MSYDVAALSNLIEQFERIPGVGQKSAQRMAFYVLQLPLEDAHKFADSIVEAREKEHFISIEDLMKRTKLSATLCDLLRESGCLNGLPETNQVSLF